MATTRFRGNDHASTTAILSQVPVVLERRE
jgi:hypothetical protein